MVSANHSQIDRLTKDIAGLRKSEAQEAKKEAELLKKINTAQEAMRRTKSETTISSKRNEIERASRDFASLQAKHAAISGKIADKTKSLHDYLQRANKDDENARKKAAEEQKKLIREREAHERRLTAELRSRASLANTMPSVVDPVVAHDFFISHASEDKEGVVRELAETLRTKGAVVWYDDFSLKVGDSLRRNIDRGLANSRFGVVILSEHFFRKKWPNKELDGLVALEVQGQTRILPIWHKVSKDEVAQYSPTLADKVALNTSLKSVEEITNELIGLLPAHQITEKKINIGVPT
jgi:hypothetical protein